MFSYPRLTRFEKARIIAARALQISMGAPVLLKTELHDPKEIAVHEFDLGILPITVKRTPPRRIE
ncbi:MAG: DNA-directed RNA polymerase subunit K [Candidatus Aenigmarchaeota archaeon]|nr:DNA-directed RNA polymerase subunit K [Candidatus Aenigmarchaeota archaeon]